MAFQNKSRLQEQPSPLLSIVEEEAEGEAEAEAEKTEETHPPLNDQDRCSVVDIRWGLRRMSNDSSFNEFLASEYNQAMHDRVETISKLLSKSEEDPESSDKAALYEHGLECNQLGGQAVMLRVFYGVKLNAPWVDMQYLRDAWSGIGTWSS